MSMPWHCQRDATGKACFPPSAAWANCSAGRYGGELQACTGSERRDTCFEHGSHQINFAACLGRVLVVAGVALSGTVALTATSTTATPYCALVGGRTCARQSYW